MVADEVTITLRLAQVEKFIRDSKAAQGEVKEFGSEVEKADKKSRLASAASGGFGLLAKTLGAITRATTTVTAGVGAAAVVLGTKSVAAATDLSETLQKTDTVFGKSGKAMKDWGLTTSQSLGMSQNDALTAASNYGNLFLNLGSTTREAAIMSKQLVTTASDLASFNNASPQEMLDAMSSALAGEYDPLQRYGFAISAAAVENKAMAMGLAESKDALSAADKAQASYKLILEQTGKAQGDFQRNGEGLANTQRKIGAQWEDLKGKAGRALLPAVLEVAKALNTELMPAMRDWLADKGPGLTKWITSFVREKALPFARWLINTGTVWGPKAFDWIVSAGTKVREFGERVWGMAKRAGGGLEKFWEDLKGGAATGGDGSAFEKLKVSLGELLTGLSGVGTELGGGISDTLNVAAVAMGWLADHTDLLAKAMPYLVGALIVYKSAQAASNAAAVFGLPLKVAEIIANYRLAASQRALVPALKANTAALRGSSAATGAETAAKNGGVVASVRHRVATVASTVATKAAAVATRVWAVAMRVLNTVMRMNPIGLIITGVILLVGAFILAYRRVGWFRAGVQTSFRLVLRAVRAVWDWVQRVWTGIGDVLADPISAAQSLIGGALDGITGLFRGAVNAIIGLWNGLDLQVSLPGWLSKVPGFPDELAGQRIDLIPDIPMLAKGGRAVAPGVAIVGEEGPELIDMPSGAQVVPLDPAAKKNLLEDFSRPIHVHVEIDRKEVALATIQGRNDLAARR